MKQEEPYMNDDAFLTAYYAMTGFGLCVENVLETGIESAFGKIGKIINESKKDQERTDAAEVQSSGIESNRLPELSPEDEELYPQAIDWAKIKGILTDRGEGHFLFGPRGPSKEEIIEHYKKHLRRKAKLAS